MDNRTILLIQKYNNCAIPDNHYAVSELMCNVNQPFEVNNKRFILYVRPVSGIHNIQLYKFWISEE